MGVVSRGCRLWALLVHLLLRSSSILADSGDASSACAGTEPAECQAQEPDSAAILQIRQAAVEVAVGRRRSEEVDEILEVSGSSTPTTPVASTASTAPPTSTASTAPTVPSTAPTTSAGAPTTGTVSTATLPELTTTLTPATTPSENATAENATAENATAENATAENATAENATAENATAEYATAENATAQAGTDDADTDPNASATNGTTSNSSMVPTTPPAALPTTTMIHVETDAAHNAAHSAAHDAAHDAAHCADSADADDDPNDAGDCEREAGRSWEMNSSRLLQGNGVGYVSDRGLDFMVALLGPSLQESLDGFLVMENHELELDIPDVEALPNLEVVKLVLSQATRPPRLEVSAELTRKGFNLIIVLDDLHANGSVAVTYPPSTGNLKVSGSAVVELKFSTSVQHGRFAVRATALTVQSLNLTAHIDLHCHLSPEHHVFCEPINTVNKLKDPLAKVLADGLKYYMAGRGRAHVNKHLATALAGMPAQLRLPGSHRLALNFTPIELSQVANMKSLAMEVLVVDSENPDISMPGTHIAANDESSGSMFTVALGSSVPNSFLDSLFSEGVLLRHIGQSMVPEGIGLQLNTGVLGGLFWAPYWKTSYATTCPVWSRCDVKAVVRSSKAPSLNLDSPAHVTAPVSVDFFVVYGDETDFMWRVNTTVRSDVALNMVPGASSCQQLLKVELTNFSFASIEITKSHRDSFVTYTDRLNTELLPFLRLALPHELAKGIVVNPIQWGHSALVLLNSSVNLTHGLLEFKTDVAAAGNCTGRRGALPQFWP